MKLLKFESNNFDMEIVFTDAMECIGNSFSFDYINILKSEVVFVSLTPHLTGSMLQNV